MEVAHDGSSYVQRVVTVVNNDFETHVLNCNVVNYAHTSSAALDAIMSSSAHTQLIAIAYAVSSLLRVCT